MEINKIPQTEINTPKRKDVFYRNIGRLIILFVFIYLIIIEKNTPINIWSALFLLPSIIIGIKLMNFSSKQQIPDYTVSKSTKIKITLFSIVCCLPTILILGNKNNEKLGLLGVVVALFILSIIFIVIPASIYTMISTTQEKFNNRLPFAFIFGGGLFFFSLLLYFLLLSS